MARIDVELVKPSQVMPRTARKATWIRSSFWTVRDDTRPEVTKNEGDKTLISFGVNVCHCWV